MIEASGRPHAQRQGNSAYRSGLFPVLPQPLLQRVHTDFLGGGHSGAYYERLQARRESTT